MSGALVWGGVSVEDLAHAYGTPLYAYDAAAMTAQLAALRDALADASVEALRRITAKLSLKNKADVIPIDTAKKVEGIV